MQFLFSQEPKGKGSSRQDKQPTHPFSQANSSGKRWPALCCALEVSSLMSPAVESSVGEGCLLRVLCHGPSQAGSGTLRPSRMWCLAPPLPPQQRDRCFPAGQCNTQGARHCTLLSMACRSWSSWSSSCCTDIKWFLWLMAEMSFRLIVWHGFDIKKKIKIHWPRDLETCQICLTTWPQDH